MSRIDESLPFHPVRIAVLTVSDSRTPRRTNPATPWSTG
jgi:molybdopterin biosynthesis enzyme MoaB